MLFRSIVCAEARFGSVRCEALERFACEVEEREQTTRTAESSKFAMHFELKRPNGGIVQLKYTTMGRVSVRATLLEAHYHQLRCDIDAGPLALPTRLLEQLHCLVHRWDEAFVFQREPLQTYHFDLRALLRTLPSSCNITIRTAPLQCVFIRPRNLAVQAVVFANGLFILHGESSQLEDFYNLARPVVLSTLIRPRRIRRAAKPPAESLQLES